MVLSGSLGFDKAVCRAWSPISGGEVTTLNRDGRPNTIPSPTAVARRR